MGKLVGCLRRKLDLTAAEFHHHCSLDLSNCNIVIVEEVPMHG